MRDIFQLSNAFFTLVLRHHQNLNTTRSIRAPIHALRRLHKLFRLRQRYIHKGLRIPIYQREPRALHLHHNPVAGAERVIDIWHLRIH